MPRSGSRKGTKRARPAAGPAREGRSPSPSLIEAVCLALALVVLLPLAKLGHLWGHDTGAHLFRLAEVARALREGVLYPRFLPDAYGGLGGPVLNFNPVLPYDPPALLVLLGLGPIAALKISAAAAMILGGVAVWALARPHVGRAAAAIAGLAYVYLPYRIANLYVRMAYSELAAMVLLPLAMAAARRAAIGTTPKRLAVSGLFMGLLLATHFPSCVVGIPAVLAYALFCAPRHGLLRAALSFALSFTLALLIGAFSWLPAIAELGGTHYQDSTTGYDNYRNHFVEFKQLLSPRWGFGQSLPGSSDQMSFQIGWVHLLALAAAIAGLALGTVPRRARPVALFCGVTVAAGALLMLEPARPIWDRVSVLQNVQFPWRILGVLGIATSLAAGIAASALRARARDGATGRGALIAPWLLAALLTAACVPYLRARSGPATDADYTPEAIRAQYFGELKFQPKEVATPQFRPQGPRAEILEGGSARIVEERTHFTAVETETAAASTLRLHLFGTPGWRARSEDLDLAVAREEGTGLVLVKVPGGRHRIELSFGDTPVRRVAWILSALGGAGALALIVAGRRLRPSPARA